MVHLNENMRSSRGIVRMFNQIPTQELLEALSKYPDLIPPGAEIVATNFGQINLVYIVRVPGIKIPKRVIIIPRPDKETNQVEQDTMEDFYGLKEVYESFVAFKSEGKIQATATIPIPRPLGLICSQFLTVMVNEFAGSQEGYFGSEETFPAFVSGGTGGNTYLGLSWIVNPSFTNETDLLRRQTTSIANRLTHHLGNNGIDSEYSSISDAIAISHIEALVKVWLLTGKYPLKYCPSAGDGVMLNKDYDSKNHPDIANVDINLITLRGGLSRVVDSQAFIQFLRGLKDKPIVYCDFKGSDLVIVQPNNAKLYEYWGGEEVSVFSDKQIREGIERAFMNYFGNNAMHYLQRILAEV